MKGVILCAGKGTRMQPFSSTVPKTLLPILNQPILYHCINKMKEVGIREIGIVIHPRQKMIIDYVSAYKGEVTIKYMYQAKPLGIAHALIQVQSFVGDDSFVLMLGDNLIMEPLHTLIQAYQGHKGSILLSQVENASDYGIAEIKNERIIKVEEKPEKPKSNLAIIGTYMLDSSIFEAIQHITPSKRGEYEITDAIQWMIEQGYSISYSITEKPYTDVGTIERWLDANQWTLTEQLGHKVQVGKNTTLENCILQGPVLIGNNCTIKNAVIGPYVSIQDDSMLTDCMVENSICLQNTKIANVQSLICRSIFGQKTIVQGIPNETEHVHFIIGDHSQISILTKPNER
ncbi:glucose-1-phosphate thymidylyltransferase [Aneurinibacillus thermoaerophilus]|uniref:Glucose-1-phosphate thymidylyltransferase n=1 Tax=Aneurinibacillus thermoaerophilus TaxID=143495 RepID=A0A1G7Y2B3_ANETH|nr:glucose-1-phosphate thymidylyltransferase [Aneurinibacillus thermoaerophilus]MED0675894.1 glucose-1-phosphate thymidylyltransferase [Aneurinibacillus thermoaerophilus]MED0677831.1 glucose-1-phosphate thymidylyltransferase [Aneurinibacillus thermoaerophilus]MED0737580.1 glucose-1-phosphate thymidylyltransferase [Aneurinibacillus thermoaerophilus]MED0758151.1 glucose-1-phosphate thymidylyltransferase [Aneurinibacillus thermoaerophilus]MED0761305.1 glucose-1-phosphate thymidylyltransferase [An